MARFGFLRPTLERQVRLLEGKQSCCTETLGQGSDDIARPIIKQFRVWIAGGAECCPYRRAGISGQDQCPCRLAVRKIGYVVFCTGVKGTSRGQTNIV